MNAFNINRFLKATNILIEITVHSYKLFLRMNLIKKKYIKHK